MAFPNPDRCVFCDVPASETPEGRLSSEHAYPDWIRRRIQPQGKVVLSATQDDHGRGVIRPSW
ncbi:MAG: hypothetical protein ACREQ5_07750 [Candidatus Dormibacteria bacterium]